MLVIFTKLDIYEKWDSPMKKIFFLFNIESRTKLQNISFHSDKKIVIPWSFQVPSFL